MSCETTPSCVRGCRRYIAFRSSLIALQCLFRRRLAVSRYCAIRTAITRLQAVARGRRVRVCVAQAKRVAAATMVQVLLQGSTACAAPVRGIVTVVALAELCTFMLCDLVSVVQAISRGRQCRRAFQFQKRAAMVIQATWRMSRCVKRYAIDVAHMREQSTLAFKVHNNDGCDVNGDRPAQHPPFCVTRRRPC